MFFEQVEKLCKLKGISPTDFVENELHMSRSNVTKWKSGKVPKSDTVQKVAAYFNASVDLLLGNEQKNKPTDEFGRLNNNEKMLLSAFRELSSDQQDMILRAAGASPENIKKANEK